MPQLMYIILLVVKTKKGRALGGVATVLNLGPQCSYSLRVCGHVTEIKVGVRGCNAWKELQAIATVTVDVHHIATQLGFETFQSPLVIRGYNKRFPTIFMTASKAAWWSGQFKL